ncbi:hypothetical protein PVAG01_08021 [Phlyctema vagabunda]|uniref:Uncharacterized protein n=1 Tax=Phlyctema vagabunda TaxID=108571 RepID=A0ABR4PE17_9HELO
MSPPMASSTRNGQGIMFTRRLPDPQNLRRELWGQNLNRTLRTYPRSKR